MMVHVVPALDLPSLLLILVMGVGLSAAVAFVVLALYEGVAYLWHRVQERRRT